MYNTTNILKLNQYNLLYMIKEEYHIRSSGIHLQTVLLQRFV
jgi:hypothetical protein